MSDRPDEAVNSFRDYVQTRLSALQRLAYLLCHDRHRADDLVQDALFKLYLKWDRARAASDLNAYARTTLVRTFLSERRTNWARRVVLVDQLPEEAFADPDGAAVVAVRRALAGLPPRQRAVIALRYYSDLSVEETAQTLGCSDGTVKSQTARGLAALRRALPEAEPNGAATTRTRS
ncbi:SigE family RNA polymerase sigma factor [Cryptosporangium aurantiacum]|uniref:RNA polymerase sigma-70 factor, sigma-E family n=1 Tax=Cryptosporangium aurantiacum TaxID=134849 RepID=A0A1M7RAU8_9ACTN|nr:SigE family RNA polymerase sigma factor [Cryptosporangium aurantiacum]SHN43414.1 RNA polymerase sigma-70 factor, sigma-E family [Cryptosporangium aurantiacum]